MIPNQQHAATCILPSNTCQGHKQGSAYAQSYLASPTRPASPTHPASSTLKEKLASSTLKGKLASSTLNEKLASSTLKEKLASSTLEELHASSTLHDSLISMKNTFVTHPGIPDMRNSVRHTGLKGGMYQTPSPNVSCRNFERQRRTVGRHSSSNDEPKDTNIDDNIATDRTSL